MLECVGEASSEGKEVVEWVEECYWRILGSSERWGGMESVTGALGCDSMCGGGVRVCLEVFRDSREVFGYG